MMKRRSKTTTTITRTTVLDAESVLLALRGIEAIDGPCPMDHGRVRIIIREESTASTFYLDKISSVEVEWTEEMWEVLCG